MERRAFLLAGPALLAARGANEKVHVAVIGVGGRGKDHIEQYAQVPDAQITAVCDVDDAQTERAVQLVLKYQKTKPKSYQDLRRLFEDKDVDAVSMATPNHWHALGTIWACQAGKDVYVEKPASYNMYEGRQMTAAARKYNRIVQVGMQSRSTAHKIRAIQLVRDGAIGKVYMARGICFKRRPSIGRAPLEPVPAGVNWDIFLGPAPVRPFSRNRFRYNWHWFWDTGNGDIGNQGIHEMDIARWGLGRELPTSAVAVGGKYVYDDEQETPNTILARFDYGDAELVFEVRGLNTGGESDIHPGGPNFVGNTFFGEKGFLSVDHMGFQIFLGDKREPGESMKAQPGDDTHIHMANFLKAVKSRQVSDLTADVREGAVSAELVHMANISYRLGRTLKFNPASGDFLDDAEASAMRTRREYRAPYVVPENV